MPALMATGYIDLGLSVADYAYTGNPNKAISALIGTAFGWGTGRGVLQAAGMPEAAFNWGASRFYSTATGQFVSNAVGSAAMALKSATGSVADSVVSIINSLSNSN